MILDIVQHPSEQLRMKSVASTISASDIALAGNMFDTIYKHKALGLSAIQVGVAIRIVALNYAMIPFKAMFNPVVTLSRGFDEQAEGCLSLNEGKQFYGPIKRAKEIRVQFHDRRGAVQNFQFGGLAARLLLHEIDHLDGVLIIDRLAIKDGAFPLQRAAM